MRVKVAMGWLGCLAIAALIEEHSIAIRIYAKGVGV